MQHLQYITNKMRLNTNSYGYIRALEWGKKSMYR